jgi:hypothetical protein
MEITSLLLSCFISPGSFFGNTRNHTNNIMQLWLTVVVKQRRYSDWHIVYDFSGTVNHVTNNALVNLSG